jgi:hypothetical protein
MTSLLTRDIPPRAALAVVALVLFASVVTGREAPHSAAAVTDRPRPLTVGSPADPIADLDLERLKRPPNEEQKIANLFATRGPAPSPPSSSVVGGAEPAAPAAPVAPPLPFRYLGRIIDGSTTAVFLARGEDNYSVEPGQMIDNQYRVEQVTDNAVTFTYLPMGARQVLSVPSIN